MRTPAKIDWLGNVTFAAGLILVLVGITYGLLPYGGHSMGWTNPKVLAEIFGGIAVLVVFGFVETRVKQPMFRLSLFRIRAFSAGNAASFLASLSRGGLMFMLIIWLQGIWLPLHGYSFSADAAVGRHLHDPADGRIAGGGAAQRHAGRPLRCPAVRHGRAGARGAHLHPADQLPVNFSYVGFAALIFLNSVGMGMFIAPNQTGIMNSLPANQRGAGAGMAGTFNASAQVLSIGIFFTLMILGLAATLPSSLYHGLTAQGVSPAVATRVSHLPPVGSLFAAFLGYNPMQVLLGHAELSQLPHSTATLPHQPPVLPPPDRARLLQGPDRGVLLRRRCLSARCRGIAPAGRQVSPRGGREVTCRIAATGCPPRRPWPRPSRCWWTEMAVSRPSARGRGARPARSAPRPASASATPRPGSASRPGPCATTRSSAC